jgi:hypothetical protein
VIAAAGLIALLAAGAVGTPAQAAVNLQVSPLSQQVTPGSEFEVTFQVTNESPAFNAFHMVVAFDSAALTAVKLSPVASQLGPLITAACPGNNVNWFHMGTSTDTIDVSMLCAGASAVGPGTIYRMHFRASTNPQVTSIRILPDVQFANAGILVPDIVVTNAAVGIGMPPITGAGAPPSGAALALTASPNPARGDVTFGFGRPLATGGTLAVHDLQGRVLRRIALAPGSPGGGWDGRDSDGNRVAPGQYVVALRASGALRTVRVTQVR